MQNKSTFPARIAPFSVLEPLPFSRVGLRKARFERETWTLLCITICVNPFWCLKHAGYRRFKVRYPVGFKTATSSGRSVQIGSK